MVFPIKTYILIEKSFLFGIIKIITCFFILNWNYIAFNFL
ncbi:hypothetical protein QE436_004378 [Pantoea anthophila]|nr:hypothetical protein [Pantoea anthophila]